MEALLQAYRSVGGVPYEAYDIHEAIGAINRPQFVTCRGLACLHPGCGRPPGR
jgi:hypothetical protein